MDNKFFIKCKKINRNKHSFHFKSWEESKLLGVFGPNFEAPTNPSMGRRVGGG